MQTSTEVLVIVGLAAILVVAGIAFYMARSLGRRRHAELRRRFGTEYDRVLAEKQGSVAETERELSARKKRVHKRPLRRLSDADRRRFAGQWGELQRRFVDDPASAVQGADELVQAVMRARGYESAHFAERVADLSVDHAHVLDHYRSAHALAEANREGHASTEQLRQAVVHYRALFAELAEEPRPTQSQSHQEAHA